MNVYARSSPKSLCIFPMCYKHVNGEEEEEVDVVELSDKLKCVPTHHQVGNGI